MLNILRTQARRSLLRQVPGISSAGQIKPRAEEGLLISKRSKSSQPVVDYVSFPSSGDEDEGPVLLNSKEHAVGYLSKVLNAKCYDAAIETQLQDAKNLSMRRYPTSFLFQNSGSLQ